MGSKIVFPEGFLWGAATSAHQVEGDNFYNDWWSAEQNKQVPFPSLKAADEYVRFEEDFDIARSLGHNAHRLSIEWSRIEPDENAWNDKEISHYREVLHALKNRGLATFVTLHHFTNPLWFTQRGGWLNVRAAEWFGEFVKVVVHRLGDLIDYYVVLNEPLVYISMGYLEGIWPPFLKGSYAKAYRVFRNMTAAHRFAFHAIRAEFPHAQIGIAQNLIDFQPRRRYNLLDVILAKTADYLWNWAFLNRIAAQLDFIGVNYYFHHHLHYRSIIDESERGHEHSDLGWGIHPEGIEEVVGQVRSRYGKPIYVTENGLADEADDKRASFIISHLRHLHNAIQKGADVRGYFYWSLMDNFEWEKGFAPRFGLVAVDYKNQQRSVRPSARVYAEICKNNSLD